MSSGWKKMAARFDALQSRERALIAAAVFGGIVLIGFSAWLDPALARKRLAERTSMEQQEQLEALRAQQVVLQSPLRDPDVAARTDLESLKKQLGELSGRVTALESSLVPPQRMPGLLEEMIGRRTGMRLVSLKTLPASPLLGKPAAETSAKASSSSAGVQAGLYKHGVEIRLEGGYAELAAYLERLEQSGLKLLWSSVSLSAEKHPKLVLTLTVYTLSLDRTWLIV